MRNSGASVIAAHRRRGSTAVRGVVGDHVGEYSTCKVSDVATNLYHVLQLNSSSHTVSPAYSDTRKYTSVAVSETALLSSQYLISLTHSY